MFHESAGFTNPVSRTSYFSRHVSLYVVYIHVRVCVSVLRNLREVTSEHGYRLSIAVLVNNNCHALAFIIISIDYRYILLKRAPIEEGFLTFIVIICTT